MAIDIRLPNITATTTEGQVSQMQSYMHQLVEQLNWALASVDNAIQGNTSNVVMTSRSGQVSEEDAVSTFNSIKALIIKSADIVTAYEETMREDFSGEYVAVSDFGTYTKDTKLIIDKNSNRVEELYSNVETIGDDVRTTNAYIKRGYLGDDQSGNAVYGIAVGETNDKGEYKNYAWFTADKLSFFGSADGHDERKYKGEVAYFSKNRLYVNDAVFLGTIQFGKYVADTSDGLAFTWVGG
jgi:hypothetical protein